MHPLKIIKVKEFPIGPTGKVDLNKLKKSYASEKVKEILKQNLKVDVDKNKNTKLNDLENYDSLTLVKIILEIESIDNKKDSFEKIEQSFQD